MNEILIEDLKKGLEIYTEEDFLREIRDKENKLYYKGRSLEELQRFWNNRTKGYKYCFRVKSSERGFYSVPFLIEELSKAYRK